MHCTIKGRGPNLVMLHGWSMHSGVWHDLADSLSQHFKLHLVDLPGHGLSDWQPGDFELTALLSWMSTELPAQACYLGWSLGGVINLAFAQHYPERVEKLALIASTPCFIQQDNWPNAMAPSIFAHFSKQLKQDQTEALQQFLLLQARGSTQSRQTIKTLAAKMKEAGTAEPDALKAGLALLMKMDMRTALSELACPSLMLLGERDGLIPHAMVSDALALSPEMTSFVIEGAGHAPFISHASQCEQILAEFLMEGPSNV